MFVNMEPVLTVGKKSPTGSSPSFPTSHLFPPSSSLEGAALSSLWYGVPDCCCFPTPQLPSAGARSENIYLLERESK